MDSSNGRRRHDELRPVNFFLDCNKHAEGSARIECGDTHVICTASVDSRIPHFLRGTEQGWITAEYGMLPRSTGSRMKRESSKGRLSGRTQEIQRLIGRSLRSVVDLGRLGERTIWLDCDVIQADGGTRTASITGAFVALALAINKLIDSKQIETSPIRDWVAAVSVGVFEDRPQLDLCYEQDFAASVDMNVVMTGSGQFVEVQGTAEGPPFSRGRLDELLDLAGQGIRELVALQKRSLEGHLGDLKILFPETQESRLAVPTGESE